MKLQSPTPVPNYVVLEGADGVGKSTIAKLLVERLQKVDAPSAHTREPTHTTLWGQMIREWASKGMRAEPGTELMWFMLDRIEHMRLVAPWLAQGVLVVQERTFISTAVYQSIKTGIDPRTICDMHQPFALWPATVVYLECDQELAAARLKEARGADAFEADVEFQTALIETYPGVLAYCKESGVDVVTINTGERNPQQTVEDVWEELCSIRNPVIAAVRAQRRLVNGD